MPPRKATYRRREKAAQPRRPDPEDARFKTTGVTEADVVRIRSKVGTGMFRDGMTVGDFLRAVPSRDAGKRMLYRCAKSKLIGFEQATIETELAEAVAERAP